MSKPSKALTPERPPDVWRTSGPVQLTRPQMMGTLIGLMLSMLFYHHDFASAVPSDIPQEAVAAFSNPLLLPQMRPQLESTFGRLNNGPHVLETLYASVAPALLGGIQWIFLISAVLMVALFLLNLLMKDVPLRHGPVTSPEPSA
jgi:hypothetical protein